MSVPAVRLEDDYVDQLETRTRAYLRYTLGKRETNAAPEDLFRALSLALREPVIDAMDRTEQRYGDAQAKRLYYLSMEFLTGRLLENNICNLRLRDTCEAVAGRFGCSLERIFDAEYDPALGNGGLGRLAACFLDSLASLHMPGYGYGINYEYGLFRQAFDQGYQVERPDHWNVSASPWQIERPDHACVVPLYGHVEHAVDREGVYNPMWMDWQVLIGVPYDMPVVGYGGETVNYLRLYAARSSDEFDMGIFNEGDYIRAVEQKISSERISKVLYPADNFEAGKELRLIQEYFFVACAIRDIMRRYLRNHDDFGAFSDQVAMQLNDTHPALAVAELQRTLVDEYRLEWDSAWEITQATIGYTNHTLLPEALERWPVPLLSRVLPRHMQIIYEINHRFMNALGANSRVSNRDLPSLSIIEENSPKEVRMANLAIVAAHSVNGVAAMHSELVKHSLVPHFNRVWPEKFTNKTNGVTQRRWVHHCNPELAALISESVGPEWITDMERVQRLEDRVKDKAFRDAFMAVKLGNKKRLATLVHSTTRIAIDPESMFDVQAKRIHEYKRQLLNAMHIIHLYQRITEGGETLETPRTCIFGGKAAPGYAMAKLIIKLINNLARIINADPRTEGQLRVAFIPDYRVTVAERLIPAADLSEQISTAGFEASGTGNMKFAMNGALTIGTLDGANVEIAEAVGEQNIFIFGKPVSEIAEMRASASYNPWDCYHGDERIRKVMDALASDQFCPGESGLFRPIFGNILHNGDYYFHLADLGEYIEAQAHAASAYQSQQTWAAAAIRNVARTGRFSSDRTIREYASDIWNISSVPPSA